MLPLFRIAARFLQLRLFATVRDVLVKMKPPRKSSDNSSLSLKQTIGTMHCLLRTISKSFPYPYFSVYLLHISTVRGDCAFYSV